MSTEGKTTKPGVRRRVLLRSAAAAPPALAAAAGLAAAQAPAPDLKSLTSAAVATLTKAARDIFPHDRLEDRIYRQAVIGYDDQAAADPALRSLLENGCARLDAECRRRSGADYAATPGEAQRLEALRAVEGSPFFAKLRGDLVVSLYNQKEVWPLFGYEGSSFEHGGYIGRGFNDLDWLEG